jgi:hypothetical protein
MSCVPLVPLQRAVLTRSDLGRADIYGTDFTNALLDKTQQMALCKYADGVRRGRLPPLAAAVVLCQLH